MGKTVQIPEDLFLDLCRYHLGGVSSEVIESHIQMGLRDKLDRMAARQDYSDQLHIKKAGL